MPPAKISRTQGGSRGSQRLSTRLSDLFEEAKSLLDLKAAWGRLPDSAMRQDCLAAVDDWFAKGMQSASAVNCVPNNDQTVPLEWLSLKEIWTCYPNLRAFLRKGLDDKTLLRLDGIVAEIEEDPF